VSSAEIAATKLPSISSREKRILQAIELGMIQHEVVPIEEIIRYSRIDSNETEFYLNSLHKNGLIYRQSNPYLGYLMNYSGYDILGLNALVQGEYLEGLGVSLGVGKESDVFEALTPTEAQVVVKFHRLGRTSFRETRRKREYLAARQHTSWLYQSRLAAEKEYEALQLASKAGIDVPAPIAQNRHIIVMEFFAGVELSSFSELESPSDVLDVILENVKKAYSANLIHTDLSEFNILVGEEGDLVIIDWPQFIRVDHPNSDEILERDLRNVVTFFRRKFDVHRILEEIVREIKS
jgi:RIO kinase 2